MCTCPLYHTPMHLDATNMFRVLIGYSFCIKCYHILRGRYGGCQNWECPYVQCMFGCPHTFGHPCMLGHPPCMSKCLHSDLYVSRGYLHIIWGAFIHSIILLTWITSKFSLIIMDNVLLSQAWGVRLGGICMPLVCLDTPYVQTPLYISTGIHIGL